MRIDANPLTAQAYLPNALQDSAAATVNSQTESNPAPAGTSPETAGNPQPDRLELSTQAREAFARETQGSFGAPPDQTASGHPKANRAAGESGSVKNKPVNPAEMTNEQKLVIGRLQSRDTEVRTHEAQHVAAAGGYALGGPVYDMQAGPDGKQYAIGGHVNLDVSPISNNPQATITKAQTIQRAALAPADPSGADRAVAAAAGQMEAEARAELSQENAQKLNGSTKNADKTAASHPGQKSTASSTPGKLINLWA